MGGSSCLQWGSPIAREEPSPSPCLPEFSAEQAFPVVTATTSPVLHEARDLTTPGPAWPHVCGSVCPASTNLRENTLPSSLHFGSRLWATGAEAASSLFPKAKTNQQYRRWKVAVSSFTSLFFIWFSIGLRKLRLNF